MIKDISLAKLTNCFQNFRSYTIKITKFFEKFLSSYSNVLQLFKSTCFWVYFWFKANLKIKNCASSTTTLKRYCKATLNVFFNKNIYDDDKIFHQYGTLFVSNKSFYLKCKLFLISRICDFCSKFQFLFKTSQYPGFSRIPGFLAILFYTIFC